MLAVSDGSTSLEIKARYLEIRAQNITYMVNDSRYYSRNRPVAKNNPTGKVNTSFKIKTRVANGDKRIAGILPNLSLVDGIHSKEVDRKSKYPSSLRSHLLFSIFSPKNNRAGAEPSYRRY